MVEFSPVRVPTGPVPEPALSAGVPGEFGNAKVVRTANSRFEPRMTQMDTDFTGEN